MPNSKFFSNFILCAVILTSIFHILNSNVVFASSTDGTIDSTSKYAWSENAGWINFGTSGGDVHVTDSAVTGYAWSENYGWINLNTAQSGVDNDGTGNLSGYAWGENLGWIDFGNVSINSSGLFTGTASGTISGTINFDCSNSNCAVQTDYRPRVARPACNNSIDDDNDGRVDYPADSGCISSEDNDESDYGSPLPGGGGPSAPLPIGFSVLIDGGNKYTIDREVVLALNGGMDAVFMAISENSDFSEVSQESYSRTKNWTLSEGEGLKNIYARFYSAYGQWSQAVHDSIIFDTTPPRVVITDKKDFYGADEEVIVSGTSEPNSKISVSWSDKYGVVDSNENGEWEINFGKLTEGDYEVLFAPKDGAGNSGAVLQTNIIVKSAVLEKEEGISLKIAPLFRKITDFISLFLPNLFKQPEQIPRVVVTVPKMAPVSLSGKWILLPPKAIKEFVLAPLPKDISMIAGKFPQLEKTFENVGITKITDVQKLKSVSLSLPTLTESSGIYKPETGGKKISEMAGVPVAKLSLEAKQKLPTEIVFARGGGESIDLNIAFSVDNKGKSEQKITTITGKQLDLVVKPQSPVKKIKGYVIFKSKTPTKSNQSKIGELFASALFTMPTFAEPVKNSNYVALEGSSVALDLQPSVNHNPADIENRLVLVEFEYTDPDGDGIYTAQINAPVVAGEYEIITVMDYYDPQEVSKEIRLVAVIDPEGYVYEKDGDKETRIPGAIVSIYWLNSETKQYELWPAGNYQQENPQTTDVRGTYSFLVPEGFYYLSVQAPGYLFYDGKPFQISEGSGVHINIELKVKYWWLKIVDWKTVVLIFVAIMLLFNFYKDRLRERREKFLATNINK